MKALTPILVLAMVTFSSLAFAKEVKDSVRHGACDYDDSRDVCVERDIFFMPGVAAVGLMPAGNRSDPFMGGGVQLTPFRWSHNNDRFGPSQGALFAQLSLLRSAESTATLALVDVGYTLSLERNSSRRFLIPYFGGTVGSFSHAELGNSAYTYQFAGAHLYWHHNLVMSAEGGYHFPFERVDTFRGPRAQLSAGFSMW
ncbi:MAG: hypothetical protein R3B13_29740 [Polyangiaceae bacterium]